MRSLSSTRAHVRSRCSPVAAGLPVTALSARSGTSAPPGARAPAGPQRIPTDDSGNIHLCRVRACAYGKRETSRHAPRAFRSHPLLDDRIAAFTGSTVKVFDKPVRLLGRNNRGDEVVTLEMSCQRWTTAAVARRFSLDPTQVLGKVYATADIGKPRKLKDIIFITSEGRKIKLDNKEDSLIGPYEDQGFLLRGNLPQTLDELDVKSVKVNLDGARLKWQLVRE